MGCYNSRIDDIIEPEILVNKKKAKKTKKRIKRRPIPLSNKIKNNRINSITESIKNGYNINQRSMYNNTPLITSCMNKNVFN